MRKTKANVISQKLKNCKKDMKKLYKLTTERTQKKVLRKNNLPPSSSHADYFLSLQTTYFLDKVLTIRNELNDVPLYQSDTFDIPQLCGFYAVTEEDIGKIIKPMSPKCCELDTIPTLLLRKGLYEVLPTVTKIMNISLTQELFPSKWKTVAVTPLLKKPGSESVLGNFRPVSNLPFLSKVLEKIVFGQFNGHCDKFSLMPDYQSAYRHTYSCETALLRILDDLLWGMRKKRCTAMAVIDLSATFDTVDHRVLLDVLHKRFGIAGTSLQWFRSYLQDRARKVNVKGQYSSERYLNFSVPQGSYTGPVLYLAYASTMKEQVDYDIALHGYADDHALTKAFSANNCRQESEVVHSLESCMVYIKEWMSGTRLKMNKGNTEFIIFGSSMLLCNWNTVDLNVNGILLRWSAVIKHLGVYIDYHLDLTKTCNSQM